MPRLSDIDHACFGSARFANGTDCSLIAFQISLFQEKNSLFCCLGNLRLKRLILQIDSGSD